MFEERDQTGSHGNELLWRNVHVVHFRWKRFDELAAFFTGSDALRLESALFVDRIVRLGDEEVFLLVGCQVFNFVGDLRVHHAAIRSFDETEFVDASIGTHRVDETNVRTFGSFDRADPAVVRWVNVADFEASTVAVETTRSKRGETTLVRQLGEWVGLVHELRELRTAKEIAHDGGKRLRVDQLLRSHAFDVHVEQGHALFDQTLCAGKTDAALVGKKFTDRTNAARTKVVNIVDDTVAFFQLEDVTDGREEILGDHDPLIGIHLDAELLVDLVTAHASEVVFLRIEEQTLEQSASVGSRWRIPRAELAVDVLERGFFVLRRILAERLEKNFVFAAVDHFDSLVAESQQLADDADGEWLVSLCHGQFAIEDIFERHFVAEFAFVHRLAERKGFWGIEVANNVAVRRVAEHTQERGRKEFTTAAAAVEVDIEQIVGVELDFEP